MAYAAVRSTMKRGLDCYMLSLPPSRLFGFLGHDPRSTHWRMLKPTLQEIYREKQRATQKARIDALDKYIVDRLMDDVRFGAFPPISVIQFEPLAPEQLTDLGKGAVMIDEGREEANRVLIDGLARVTAVLGVRERLELENPAAFEILKTFEFSVALYVPTTNPVGPEIAGQLFTDFNSYAWPVPVAKTIADDVYNPYKIATGVLDDSEVLRRHGGLKKGSANLGKRDTAFTTELTMAQFCKVAIEGRRGYGKFNKPLNNPRIAKVDPKEAGQQIAEFLAMLEQAMGSERFADRSQIFRTAHGLYAIAVIINDALFERRTSVDRAIEGLASIDWTWNNQAFRGAIARQAPDGQWKLNTGMATLDWLVRHLRGVCNVVVTQAA